MNGDKVDSSDQDRKAAGPESLASVQSGQAGDSPGRVPDAPEFDFQDLSGGGKTVYIRFGSVVYRLNRTRSGRLVLHK
ncbi:MAG: hemin uptake protein HemP [Planctomycetota bacterium]